MTNVLHKLKSIFYQIIGKPMRKGGALNDARSIKDIYDMIQSEWIDKFGPAAEKIDLNLPSTSTNINNMLS